MSSVWAELEWNPNKIKKKTGKNCVLFARILYNFLYLYQINLKIFLSCSSQFFLSGKYPLDILYWNFIFFTPQAFLKNLLRASTRKSIYCYHSAPARTAKTLNSHNSKSLHPFWLIFLHKIEEDVTLLLTQLMNTLTNWLLNFRLLKFKTRICIARDWLGLSCISKRILVPYISYYSVQWFVRSPNL